MMIKIYSIEEFFEFVPEVGVLDEFDKILVYGLSGNFLMSVVEDELFELGLELLVSVGILEEVSEMGVFEVLIVVGLKGGPGLGGLHGV
jgi:hypothetical protein